MNNTMAVLERVAAGELTPEQAAEDMIADDQRARTRPRPKWAPRWAWAVGVAACGLVLAFFGVQKE